MYPQQPAPQTVVAPGLFDSGARFDGVAQARIPVSISSTRLSAKRLENVSTKQLLGSHKRNPAFSAEKNIESFFFMFFFSENFKGIETDLV